MPSLARRVERFDHLSDEVTRCDEIASSFSDSRRKMLAFTAACSFRLEAYAPAFQ